MMKNMMMKNMMTITNGKKIGKVFISNNTIDSEYTKAIKDIWINWDEKQKLDEFTNKEINYYEVSKSNWTDKYKNEYKKLSMGDVNKALNDLRKDAKYNNNRMDYFYNNLSPVTQEVVDKALKEQLKEWNLTYKN